MNKIECIMNFEKRNDNSSFKHCGKNLVCDGFFYEHKGIILLWKGHLYNRSLDKKSSVIDPVCIIDYYLKNGIYKTLRRMNGDFSLVLLDPCITGDESVLYVAMDIFGMFPLFTFNKNEEIHITETEITKEMNRRFLPSCYSKYTMSHRVHSLWTLQEANTPYYIRPIPMPPSEEITTCVYQNRIKNIILNNVQKRIEAYNISKDNSTFVLLLEEQGFFIFQIILETLKSSDFTPLLCSKEDPLLQEENDHSQLFIFTVSQNLHRFVFHEKHVVLYPCVDVFFLQYQILSGNTLFS